ncbi:MAG: TIGR02710 family CRISPR-associated protein [Syntrophus sp. (in: bacteria)]|nr:TIGR02710 family CRISPR-associated protein [Syntrophus sp. (in: bacteria)]
MTPMDSEAMTKTMIMSLGGSPEPLLKSIVSHQPGNIIFLASHDSVALAGEILKMLDFRPAASYEITDDPNIMYECYKKARSCVDRTKKMGVAPQNVIVDYTGGTKVMTAALILATIGQPFQFNYVGGEQRNKNGLGIVMDGHEKMFAEMNPWSVFAEEERRQIVTLFNRRRFSAVMQIIDDCSTRELPLEIVSYFAFVRPFAEGFLFWEQFQHDTALRKITSGMEKLATCLKVNRDHDLETFGHRAEQCRLFLDRLLSDTDNMKTLHPALVDDLLNNARRRMADKRYDDAAARIYRALELYGQICFQEVAGCATDTVKPDMIPEKIREEYIRKYLDAKKNVLKLPMTATFEYLKVKGHPAGIRFFEKQKEIKSIQSNRNASILAHGIQPVSEKAIGSIFATVTEFVQFTNIFDFPALP